MKRIKGLYAIADYEWNPLSDISELVYRYLQGGANIVQLRMKNRPGEEVYAAAERIIKYKDCFDFTFIVNDYIGVADKVGADGVHVGKNDMPLKNVREILGNKFLIGYSSHSFEEALQAQREGANYVALGAIFKTATKGPGHPILGLEELERVTKALSVPVVAIGGIKRENISQVFEAGASAAAMITALTNAEDIIAETKWFIEKIKYSPPRHQVTK